MFLGEKIFFVEMFVNFANLVFVFVVVVIYHKMYQFFSKIRCKGFWKGNDGRAILEGN